MKQDATPGQPDGQYLTVLQMLMRATADPHTKVNRIHVEAYVNLLIEMKLELPQAKVVVGSLRQQAKQLGADGFKGLYSDCIHKELERGISGIQAAQAQLRRGLGPELPLQAPLPATPVVQSGNGHAMQA